MSKINHNRPYLRFIDNLRRELARDASTASLVGGHARDQQQRETSNDISRMPRLGARAAKIALSLLDLLVQYYDNQSLLIKSISPESSKSERKRSMKLRADKDSLEKRILEQSIKLVTEAFARQVVEDSSVAEWIDWLQAEAISMDSYALIDLFEIGIKPAFEAVSDALSKKASER